MRAIVCLCVVDEWTQDRALQRMRKWKFRSDSISCSGVPCWRISPIPRVSQLTLKNTSVKHKGQEEQWLHKYRHAHTHQWKKNHADCAIDRNEAWHIEPTTFQRCSLSLSTRSRSGSNRLKIARQSRNQKKLDGSVVWVVRRETHTYSISAYVREGVNL